MILYAKYAKYDIICKERYYMQNMQNMTYMQNMTLYAKYDFICKICKI